MKKYLLLLLFIPIHAQAISFPQQEKLFLLQDYYEALVEYADNLGYLELDYRFELIDSALVKADERYEKGLFSNEDLIYYYEMGILAFERVLDEWYWYERIKNL